MSSLSKGCLRALIRFPPTDEELVIFYLASKVFNGGLCGIDIAEMGEREWYFFSLRDRKYPTGLRTNRAIGAGYWKATGKDQESGATLGSMRFRRGDLQRHSDAQPVRARAQCRSRAIKGGPLFLAGSLHVVYPLRMPPSLLPRLGLDVVVHSLIGCVGVFRARLSLPGRLSLLIASLLPLQPSLLSTKSSAPCGAKVVASTVPNRAIFLANALPVRFAFSTTGGSLKPPLLWFQEVFLSFGGFWLFSNCFFCQTGQDILGFPPSKITDLTYLTGGMLPRPFGPSTLDCWDGRCPPLLGMKWHALPHPPPIDLLSLEAPFSMAEVLDPVIGGQVLDILRELHNNPSSMTRINTASIVLILKFPRANTVSDFRPISLKNNIIKIFSKVQANCLSPLILDLVDNLQGAFTRGRSTLNYFMTSSETIWGCKKMDRDVYVIKVDFEKAFNSVNWDFLMQTMTFRGFPPRWSSWILNILRSAESSLLINGSKGRSFRHRRGTRQGNTLSPLLFNLVIDSLSRFLVRAESLGLVTGALNGLLQKSITHIFFADDLLLFCKAGEESMRSLGLIIKCFELCSGLKLNSSKTKVIHIDGDIHKASLAYLGRPLRLGGLTKADWSHLITRFDSTLASWQGSVLSRAGRLTLVNNVLGSQASYYLSIFLAPKWVYNRLDKRMRNLFWTGKGDASSQGKCLVNWNSHTYARSEGGLRILALPAHNKARLTNWIWKLFLPGEMPWQNIISSLYPRILELNKGDRSLLSPI
ncbi:hypothetical protein Cni_G22354 [Canna indica]|uniref:Reverse transcriptase domain-containing protein n=1 Tax=Canna indica TaxID=4628 RepID=A0AAQ3KRQ2_9LILI|nr:hypothetical protein Cni_G22354 [Canna indica]